MHLTPRLRPVTHPLLIEAIVASLLLLAAGLWQLWFPVGLWQAFDWSIWYPPLGVLSALPPLLLILLLELPLNWRWLCTFRDHVDTLLVPLVEPLRWPELLALAGLAGFSEEIFFRGVLQQKLGLVLSSLIFGTLHAISLPYMMWATATGLYLGWLWQATQTLWVPIFAHTVIDLVGLLYLRLVVRRRHDAHRSGRGG